MGTSVLRTSSLWLGVPGATDIFQSNTVTGTTGYGVASEFYVNSGTYAFLNVSSISSSDVTTMVVFVPQPSTWAMVPLGFAGLGFMGWRGSRRTDGRHSLASATITSL